MQMVQLVTDFLPQRFAEVFIFYIKENFDIDTLSSPFFQNKTEADFEPITEGHPST